MPRLVKRTLQPFWQTPDGAHALYLGNVTDVLSRLPERSVQCCVTSPPYWGLRDYGTGGWQGGDPSCEHKGDQRWYSETTQAKSSVDAFIGPGEANKKRLKEGRWRERGTCVKCGAVRTDYQIGNEPSPDCLAWARADGPGWDLCGACFVCSMVAVFRGVRRVLRDDGVLWLNLGDTYSAGSRTGPVWANQGKIPGVDRNYAKHRVSGGLPGGNLVGTPWRTAFALQADGWVLRSDLPWVKRSSMPESVVNRPAKALEYWFQLVKGMGYYFDMEAVRKANQPQSVSRVMQNDGNPNWNGNRDRDSTQNPQTLDITKMVNPAGRSFRNTDLWFQSVDGPHGLVGVGDELVGIDVTTRGYAGAHFATYSPHLITPLIKAGTSARGACAECGAPWERVVDSTRYEPVVVPVGVRNVDASRGDKTRKLSDKEYNDQVRRTTTGWQPTCECYGRFVKRTVRVMRPVSCEQAAGLTGGAYAPPGQEPHSNARPPGLAGPKGAGRIASGIHQGGVTSSTLGVGNRDRSLPSNRNGISGSLDGVPRDTEEVEEEQWVYESDLALDDHPTVPCRVLDPFMGCYDDQTWVATRRGFVPWTVVTECDEFLSRSETGELSYNKATAIIRKPWNGPVHVYSGRSLDLVVTPDHQMFLRRHHDEKARLIPSQDATYRLYHIPNRSRWSTVEDIPTTWNTPIGTVSADKWFRFVGLYLAEGSVNWTGKGHRTEIKQSKQLTVEPVRQIVTGLFPNVNEYVDGSAVRFRVTGQPLAEWARSVGRQPVRRVPREMLDAHPQLLQALLEGLLLGDGHIHGKVYQYFTTSHGLAMDVCELLTKLGRMGTIGARVRYPALFKGRLINSSRPQYTVSSRQAKETKVDMWDMRSIGHYKGVVYCATVPPHHTLLVMRNGKTAWCGNSGTTGAVCVALGLRSWGIDLSETYLREHAIKRIGQAILEKNGPGELVAPKAERVDL